MRIIQPFDQLFAEDEIARLGARHGVSKKTCPSLSHGIHDQCAI